MKSYLEHITSKSTHERRTHAMQLSAAITGGVFLVWISTLEFALRVYPAGKPPARARRRPRAVIEAQSGNATLLVSTTTDSYGQ